MNKTGKSEEVKEFQWKDYLKNKIDRSEESKIHEFIIYQKPGQAMNKYFIRKYEKTQEQNLEILNLIQEILNSTVNLSPNQIINYCNSQRHFMKLYFKQLQQNQK